MFEGNIFLQKQQQPQQPRGNIRNGTSHTNESTHPHAQTLQRIKFSCNKNVQQALLSNAVCRKQQQCPLDSTHRYIVIHTYLLLSNFPSTGPDFS